MIVMDDMTDIAARFDWRRDHLGRERGPLPPYAAIVADFAWNLPAEFNIAAACADDWATIDPARIALIEDRGEDAAPIETSFGELATRSRRLAAGLAVLGVTRGDRVAIVLPQGVEAALAHLAVYRLGAIAVPLAQRFGPEALGYRLAAAGCRLAVLDDGVLETLAAIETPLDALSTLVVADRGSGFPDASPALAGFRHISFVAAEAHEPIEPPCVKTTPDDPAMIIFTSGTTGAPKGALHGHRVLIGHLPGMRFFHEGFPHSGDRLWTPSDWAWAGGLLNALLPSLYYGVPVVFTRARFIAEEALAMMARRRVRNAFLPATALRMLKAAATPERLAALSLRTIGSAGESLPAATFEWAREAFGAPVNEFYGQTECNMVLGSAAGAGASAPGRIGPAAPGHCVAVLKGNGTPAAPGEAGTIAVKAPDPVMFLGYWQNEAATGAKFVGEWLLTGDQGVADEAGSIAFLGRDDDIITSAGYRIGSSEVEDCLLRHPAVKLAAVVGKPDPVRTEIVKAYVVAMDGIKADETLGQEIAAFVRARLSAHEYPREIAFVDEMPMTTSGKIIRRHFRALAAKEAEAEPNATVASPPQR